ncbi:hypothetical protein [Streptomyces sp. NPDC093111]|uniref:hypothetical protein n=1 Tax=Streptomyces sp. NPDC093111 TaxID=3154978 RepID=UPI003422263E
MDICRATHRLPYVELLTAMRDAGANESEYPKLDDAFGTCALGEKHNGRHMGSVYAPGAEPELWVQWDDDKIIYVRVPICAQDDLSIPLKERMACWLPLAHDCGHSWEAREWAYL